MSLSVRLREVSPSEEKVLFVPARVRLSKCQTIGRLPTTEGKLAVRESHRELSTTCRTQAHSAEKGVFSQESDAALSNSKNIIPELTLDAEEYVVLQSFRDTASKLTVLGQLPDSSPGYQALKDWAFSSLHSSITACVLVGNGFFEVQFANEEGVKAALSRIHFFEGREVLFTPWNADFSPQNPASSSLLKYPLWIQFLGIGLPLCNETCLRILGGKYGKVLHYKDLASFLGKTMGLRVKVLVKDSTKIPEWVRIKGALPGVFYEHKILLMGHPNQCVCCHVIGHNSRSCPQLAEDWKKQ